MTRWTVLMLQSHPDEKDGEGIGVEATGPHPNGKYAGWVTFWKDRRPHISPMISTEPIYDTAVEAEATMRQGIATARAIDLSATPPAPEPPAP